MTKMTKKRARELGAKGGLTRAKTLSKARRKEIARLAAMGRWGRGKDKSLTKEERSASARRAAKARWAKTGS